MVGLAQECGLELVFKLHPFESVAGHQRILRSHLDPKTADGIRVIAGPLSAELWQHTHCALTVQSTVALECSARGVPIFMCGWLADSSAGYVQQFQKFGVGHVLRSPAELDQVPEFIASSGKVDPRKWMAEPLDPEVLRQLLHGAYARPALASA